MSGTDKMCVDCGEERATLPEDRCRDCDIEFHMERAKCEHCGRHIWNENAADLGLIPWNHTDDCPRKGTRS